MKSNQKKKNYFIPISTDWFDKQVDKYFDRNDFKYFQDLLNINLRNLISKDSEVLKSTQQNLTQQSVILNEVQKEHYGFGLPFLVYTHCFDLFEKPQKHNHKFDHDFIATDMCDSLRRRHIALSKGIIPKVIKDLYKKLNRPIIINNMGSGTGLDILNVLCNIDNKYIQNVYNYDINYNAIELGLNITSLLENKKLIKPGIVKYVTQSYTKSSEKVDLIIKIGIICGLTNEFAIKSLTIDNSYLNSEGMIIVSSSNTNMECFDPFPSFLIQHIGTKDDPFQGWGLNFRTDVKMKEILTKSGYSEISLYSDTNFPGLSNLSEDLLLGIDDLPAKLFGYKNRSPINLPSKEILNQKNSFHWLAVASKAKSL